MKKTITYYLFALAVSFSASLLAENEDILKATQVEGEFSLDAAAWLWDDAPAIEVALQEQIIVPPKGGGSTKLLKAQAAHNGRQIAFRLEWDDDTLDRKNGVDTYRDSVAVQFPVKPPLNGEISPLMGDEKNPVNIWQWRADWQGEIQHNREIEEEQPATAGVYISPLDNEILKTLNPPRGLGGAAVEYTATGWTTLTAHKVQDVSALGKYKNGKWAVVFVRNLTQSDKSGDAAFERGGKTLINFAVWNGDKDEVNGRKSVSFMWKKLILE